MNLNSSSTKCQVTFRYLFFFSLFLRADSVADDAFDNLIQLQYLFMKKNFITEISEKHFKNVENLLILDIAVNKIQKIHRDAFKLEKLSELNLSQNNLKEIPKKLFIALKSLKKLMLFSNDLSHLSAGIFDGLRWVSISAHKWFWYTSRLKRSCGKFFINFVAKKFYLLHIKELFCLKTFFLWFDFSSLTNLLLNNNNLKDFDANLFVPLVNLQKLWVVLFILNWWDFSFAFAA